MWNCVRLNTSAFLFVFIIYLLCLPLYGCVLLCELKSFFFSLSVYIDTEAFTVTVHCPLTVKPDTSAFLFVFIIYLLWLPLYACVLLC